MSAKFTRFLFLLIAFVTISTSAFSMTVPKPVGTEPDPATVKAAMAEFNSLTKKEKKQKVNEVKKVLQDYKAAKKAGNAPSTNTLLLVILAILLPPLAVYLHEGELNSRFWISLILTLLFFIPGVIYALIVVLGS